jgi:flagellar biosynthesis/type III secretory pathway ATPase
MPAGVLASRSISVCVRSIPSLHRPPRPAHGHIFSGSNVCKSVRLSILAHNVSADISVIALVGERGREVQGFLQDDLGPAGLARSVVVVSTSDEPALMRHQGHRSRCSSPRLTKSQPVRRRDIKGLIK